MGEYLIAFILGGVAGIAIGLIVARVGALIQIQKSLII